MSLDDLRALNAATSQRDRLAGAPAPGRVRIDGRSLAEVLAFAADYGALIRFYDLADAPQGHWSAFFLVDESIRLALWAGLDVKDIEGEFDRLLADLRRTRGLQARLERVETATAVLLKLMRILDQDGVGAAGLSQALERLAASSRRDLLAAPAKRLAAHLGQATPAERLRKESAAFSDSWFEQFVDFLQELAGALVTALSQGRARAVSELEASLHSQTHPPQSGLYDAFAVLLGHAQASINRFPERLIEFYAADVLRQTRRAGSSDSVWLTFTPAKGVDRVELPKDAVFVAGVDAKGDDIGYALETELAADAAAVSDLCMVTATQAPPVPDAEPAPAQVFSGSVALADAPPTIAAPVPLFGAASAGEDGPLTTTLASLGFAIASPTLLLAGGARTISVGLCLTPDSVEALTPILTEIGAVAGLAPEAVLAALIRAGLSLSYSTAGGWVAISDFSVTAPAADTADAVYTLVVELDPDADPVLPMDATPAAADATPPDGAVPDAATPTLMAALVQAPATLGDPDAPVAVYPYAVLSRIVLERVSVTAAVKDLSDLEVTTPTGPADTSQPFPTFGSPPVQYATLDVRAEELFVKRVTSLSLTLGWFGLPVTSTGFRGYYLGYVIDANGVTQPPGSLFGNASFQGALSVDNPGDWTIVSDDQYLFATRDETTYPADAPVLDETVLPAAVEPSTPPAYYDPASSAVRLTLTQPDYAFGAVLYAPNVVAASLQATAAASACAQRCAELPRHRFRALIEPVAAANGASGDAELGEAVKAATAQALAALDKAATHAIDEAVARSSADPATQTRWRAEFADALGAPRRGGLPRFFPRRSHDVPDAATVHEKLSAWLSAWSAGASAQLGPAARERADAAQALIDAGDALGRAQATVERQPAAQARATLSAALIDIQARLDAALGPDGQTCVQKCMAENPVVFPNQPWLPQTSRLSLTYTAETALPSAADATASQAAAWYYLTPFDTVMPVAWSAGEAVPLLAPIPDEGALYIGLSSPMRETATLLFRLAPPAGGWPTDTPAVAWAAANDTGGWTPLTPLRDTTNGLKNSGIVTLTLEPADPDAPLWLRVSTQRDASGFPDLAALVTNAATARWIGPGGAETLGTPLAAGSIAKSLKPMPGLGTVDQPEPSVGGAPEVTGPSFFLWLAERLRHKDYGIQAWDYARLALAAFPSLWQLAVVPASDGTGAPTPGHVWIVPVPGPETPAIADRTIPSNDATMLKEIGDFLSEKISPFIKLVLTNPPYLRLTVDADVFFAEEDSVEACCARLNDELVDYLSPWPTPGLGPRPADYYTRRQVAHFIRHRPYVRGISSLRLIPAGAPHGWRYLTSALQHEITGKTQSESRPGADVLVVKPPTERTLP